MSLDATIANARQHCVPALTVMPGVSGIKQGLGRYGNGLSITVHGANNSAVSQALAAPHSRLPLTQ